MEDEKELVTYLLIAIPWKDCPFKLYMAVGTEKGEEDAKRVMREYYHNQAMEFELCTKIPITTSEIFDEMVRKLKVAGNC